MPKQSVYNYPFAAVIVLGSTQAVHATDAFYKGKTITTLVSVEPGGSDDSVARIVARHLSNYIDGAPNIVVQNMPGGGGKTLVGSAREDMKLGHSTTDFLGQVAPAVGSSFKQLRAAIQKAGPLDNVTFELILTSALAVAGLELPFKNHVLEGLKHGITKEAPQQTVLIPFAATATTFSVVLALHWIDEVYEEYSRRS